MVSTAILLVKVLWGRVKSTCHIARIAQKEKVAGVFELGRKKDR
jgi:hypothetical protein